MGRERGEKGGGVGEKGWGPFHLSGLTLMVFNGICSAQLKIFVDGLFHLNTDIPQFKEHLRDFLVQIKVRVHIMLFNW